MPMVWYIPPLSPVVDILKGGGHDAEDAPTLFGAIDALRIPIGYLAELFTAGDARPVRDVLARLAAMRSYMRDVNLNQPRHRDVPEAVGMSEADVEDMYRLLALAKYDERYVIPPAHGELHDQAGQLEELACSLDYEGGPGMGGSGPFGESSGGPQPIAVENFHALAQRQRSDVVIDPGAAGARVNLLNWDGKGAARDVMPPRSTDPAGSSSARHGDGETGGAHT
jgi:nitrate reductase beta subunit